MLMLDLIDQAVERMEHPYQVTSDRLGWSKLETWMQCGRRYYYQYVERAERTPNIAGLFGSCVHETISAAHRMAWTVDDMTQAAALMNSIWERVGPADDPKYPQYQRFAQAAAESWLPWYLQWSGEQVTVAHEERWMVDLDVDGSTIELQGTWDRLYKDPDGSTIISDVKTGGNIPHLPTSGQLSMYSFAYRASAGKAEGALEIVKMRGKLAPETPRTSRTDEYLADFIAHTVVQAVRGINAGVYPCNPDAKYGCGFCGYRHLCPVGGESADD